MTVLMAIRITLCFLLKNIAGMCISYIIPVIPAVLLREGEMTIDVAFKVLTLVEPQS